MQYFTLLASKKAMNTFVLNLVQYVTDSLKAKLIKHKHSYYYFCNQIAGSHWQEIPQISSAEKFQTV